MNCPKCGKDMVFGFLQTGNLIAFNKTRHKISLNPKHEEDVMIAKKAFISNDFHASTFINLFYAFCNFGSGFDFSI